MGNRRMFSANEIQSDNFLELSFPAQVLYFQLAVSADDEGFLSRIKGIERLSGTTDGELKELVESGFVIRFDSGVCVIANWYANNLIRKDRFHETTFVTEKRALITNDNSWYTIRQPVGNQTPTSGVLNEPNEPNELKELNESKESKELNSTEPNPLTAVKSNTSKNESPDIPEETIRSVLTRNKNDVNNFVIELINSGLKPSSETMNLIHKVSGELKSEFKAKNVINLDKVIGKSD
ncbi:hypothetical protein [Liquorilactobacillus hordei]|uniref:hypothetical protein n=1 Tax=Liquorilactobacillus hordei TaxID=468911 RepID=UPI001CBD1FEC|nr:hypothetical protein [Liquorilactobacillus hordei]MBZ2406129.1 hypothetical protein [Liquorilactobacillus hordei]